jgi:hypothetical protein
MRTSEHLEVGRLYSRGDLKEMFDISDATLYTGVFTPRGHQSIWLFVTENKTKDHPPYEDHLRGDVLEWDSQPSGRRDEAIKDHRVNGFELLVFLRRSKNEYPDYAFRYEGVFEYVSHKRGLPLHFTLRRVS